MLKQLSISILATSALSFASPSFAQTTLLEMETGKVEAQKSPVIASSIDYGVFDEMMRKVAVEQGGRPRIAYDFLREQNTQFIDDYIQYLEGQTVEALPKDEQLAYWLNLQNILVVKAVLDDSKKKKSLKKLRGTADAPGPLWTKQRITVAGQNMSLQDIEGKLLTEFDTPNVIYGIYQGVRGGPSLTSTAYRGSNVQDMLAKNATRYINSKGIVRVNRDVVEVTPIFLWYNNDVFGGEDMALTEHLKAYAYPNLKSNLYRGKSFEAKKLNYRLDNYVVPEAQTESTTRSRSSGGGYGS